MVSDADRRAMQRQARALASIESDDEGSADWRQEWIERLDVERQHIGVAPLKTEGELHRRARALGLLDRIPPTAR